MSEIVVVSCYQRGDEKGIVHLLDTVFNGWPQFSLKCSSLEHWRWKHLDNLLGSQIVVCKHGDMIVGCHHRVLIQIKLGDERFLCSYGGDLAVHPKHRRKGIRNTMRDYLNELSISAGLKFTYFLTDNPLVYEKLPPEWRFPLKVLNLVQIKDIDEFRHAFPSYNSWFVKVGFSLLNLLNRFRTLFNERKNKFDIPQVNPIERFDERVERFCEIVSKNYCFIVQRTREYLNWRYCDRRSAGDFVVKVVEDDYEIHGYSVLYINKINPEYPVGYIVDLLTLPRRLDIADALFQDAVNHFNNQDVNIVLYHVVKGHPYQSIASDYGFLDSRIEMPLFFRPLLLKNGLDMLTKINGSKAFLCWGDYDTFPINPPNTA